MTPKSGMTPSRDTVEAQAPAVALAATQSVALDTASQTGVVASVKYTPTAVITGAATNNRRLDLVNRGQDGTGAAVIATLTFGAGINAAAYDQRDVPVTPANAAVAAGDILEWRSTAVGTGLADPGGLVQVDIDRD